MTSKDETRRARPVPPTRLTLNRDYIATVALSLIDDIGLDKFSMRKLGTELGVDPMAVYRYFTDQETLFDGVAEALFEELDVESLPWQGTWRQLCEQFQTDEDFLATLKRGKQLHRSQKTQVLSPTPHEN